MNEDIVAVSLFSGAGGLDIASVMAGVPVISSTDFDSDCIATLKANEEYFGDTEIFEGDLHEIDRYWWCALPALFKGGLLGDKSSAPRNQ